MKQLPAEIQDALQNRRLLVVWGDMPFELAEHAPDNRAVAINQLQQRAAQLPAPNIHLNRIPPLPILSLDCTDRLEREFQGRGLSVVHTRQDVFSQIQYTLIQLAGDLNSRTGVILSRDEIRSLLSDADKRYLIDLVRSIVQVRGAVMLVGSDPANADFKLWWSVLRPVFGIAPLFAAGDPAAPWPDGVTCLGSIASIVEAAFANSRAFVPTIEDPSPKDLKPDFDIYSDTDRTIVPVAERSGSGGVNANAEQINVGGDVVGRDKIDQHNVNIHVDQLIINEPSASKGVVESQVSAQALRLDTAVPERVFVSQPFDLAVAVRQTSSSALTAADLPRMASGEVQVEWPQDAAFIRLRIEVRAPECEIADKASQSFRLLPGKDSPVFYFHLTPRQSGDLSIFVTVYQEDDSLGSARVHTVAVDQPAGQVQVTVPSNAQSSLSEDKASLQRQLNEARKNLTLIEERKAQFVLEVDVPLQLVKEERRLKDRIAELESRLNE